MELDNTDNLFRLDRVKELLDEAHNSPDKTLRLADFAAATVIVQRLEKNNGRYDLDYDSNLEKPLTEIKYRFAAMLNLEVSHGENAEQHYVAAMNAIERARSQY